MTAKQNPAPAGRIASAALLGLLVAAPLTIPAADAQISSKGGPISYSADSLEYRDEQRVLVLTGNVDVVQNDSRIQSDKLTLFFSGGGAQSQSALATGDIRQIVAEGRVFYVTPQQKARGDRAVYDTAADSVTFTGRVVVASEDNVVRGETLVLEIGGGRTTIRPGAGARVQGVFRPRPGSNEPKQPRQ